MNCPQASSAGRLFDAVAGAVGICQEKIQYEGQAAIELENCIDQQAWLEAETSAYPFVTDDNSDENQLNPAPMWKALLKVAQLR